MFRRKENNFAKYTATFLLGAVAGAAVALLYAPMKGSKLQGKLKDAIEEQADNVEKLVRKAVNA